MSEPVEPQGPIEPPAVPARSAGRRASAPRRRRVDVLVALAVALPAVVAIGIAAIGDQSDPTLPGLPPTTADLTVSTVICPSAVATGAGPVRVARPPGVAGGELGLSVGDADSVELAEAAAIDVTGEAAVALDSAPGPVVIDGRDAAAPGIVAGRDDRLAVPECRAPSYDEWLVGLGASARFGTVLELVNPDDGEAVVDIELYDAAGAVSEPALRGVQVPARGVRRIDLATEAPRVEDTAAHVTVTRGRVTVTARATRDQLGSGRVSTDFLPAQAGVDDRNLILGVPDRAANATLFVMNPGEDEVRGELRLVTADATFLPTDAPEIVVAPGTMQAVALGPVLSAESAAGVTGVVLDTTGPVAASVRVVERGDLVLLAPPPSLEKVTAAVVPAGEKTLVLGGATGTGVAQVVSYDATGAVLADEAVEISPDRAIPVAIPPAAVRVTVEPRRTRISGVFSMPATAGGPLGLATLRLRPAQVQARIPVVIPEAR